jgi:hypothetical protein
MSLYAMQNVSSQTAQELPNSFPESPVSEAPDPRSHKSDPPTQTARFYFILVMMSIYLGSTFTLARYMQASITDAKTSFYFAQ